MGYTKKKLVKLYAKKLEYEVKILRWIVTLLCISLSNMEKYGTLKVYTDFTQEKNICIGTITVNKYSITKLKVLKLQ